MADKNEYGWLPLSKAAVRTGIPLSGTPGNPGRHCPMHTALALAKQLGHVSTLVVGTAECGYYSRYVMTEPKGNGSELHYVYELDASEVVFGCRTGLMEAVIEMDREGAELILLILTCVPALIGEDMEAVIQEMNGKISAKLIYIDGAHFKYNGYLSGYSDTYSRLGEVYRGLADQGYNKENRQEFERAESRKTGTGTSRINFLGNLRGKEALALKSSLTGAGYELLELNQQNITGKLEKLWSGSLSILQDPNQGQLAKTLEKPVISLCRSFPAEDIRESYHALKDMLGLEGMGAEEFQLGSYELLKEKEESARRELKGIPFIITVQELLALPAASYLASLGMEPKLLGVERFLEEDGIFRERILKEGCNPYLVTLTEEKNVKEWARAYPLLSIGHSTAVWENRTVKNPQVQKIFASLGYERSLSLLDCLLELAKGMEKGGTDNGLI